LTRVGDAAGREAAAGRDSGLYDLRATPAKLDDQLSALHGKRPVFSGSSRAAVAKSKPPGPFAELLRIERAIHTTIGREEDFVMAPL
jgi:hypothetical protein